MWKTNFDAFKFQHNGQPYSPNLNTCSINFTYAKTKGFPEGTQVSLCMNLPVNINQSRLTDLLDLKAMDSYSYIYTCKCNIDIISYIVGYLEDIPKNNVQNETIVNDNLVRFTKIRLNPMANNKNIGSNYDSFTNFTLYFDPPLKQLTEFKNV